MSEKRLPESFYIRDDVVQISKDLLGKKLVTNLGGHRSSGIIVETEAYRGPEDKASHAFNNRFTARTKPMYWSGGHTYVYLCYGIHHLFNIVTGPEGIPHAVLIRAIAPSENKPLMLKRRNFSALKPQLTAGPGVMSKALGITTHFTGINMLERESPIWVEDQPLILTDEDILASPRVGVDYAGECVFLPWRFRIKNSPWTSKAK